MEYILETLGKVGFEWKMALFNLINFLIVFYVLKRMFFAPTIKMIEDRKQKAADADNNFLQAKTELTMAEQRAQSIIDDAKKQANGIVAQAVKDSASLAESMRLKAVADVEALVTQAKQTIASEKGRMKEEIQRETADLVLLALQKVLGETIDSKKDKKIVSDVLARLSE